MRESSVSPTLFSSVPPALRPPSRSPITFAITEVGRQLQKETRLLTFSLNDVVGEDFELQWILDNLPKAQARAIEVFRIYAD
jgi:hypothetical protein